MNHTPHLTTNNKCRQGFTLVELLVAASLGSAILTTLIRFSQASTLSDAMLRARITAAIENQRTFDFIAQDIRRASGYISSVQAGRPPNAQPVLPVAAGCTPPAESAALFVLLSTSGNQNENVVYYGYAGRYTGPGGDPADADGWADSARLFRCGPQIVCTGTPQTCTPGPAIVTSFVAHAARVERPAQDCAPELDFPTCLNRLRTDYPDNQVDNLLLVSRVFPLRVNTFACYITSGTVVLDRTTKWPTPASGCLPPLRNPLWWFNEPSDTDPNAGLITMNAPTPVGGVSNGVF